MDNYYLKIEGTGGGSSGSGIGNIEVYDQNGSLVKLKKSDVTQTNANTRDADSNYVELFQTRGGLAPYNTIASGIYYVIKLPEHVDGFAKIYLKNWGNTSYDIRNIKISVSYDNIVYEEIFNSTLATSEEKTVLQNYTLKINKLLLESNNKVYSLKYQNIFEPLAMTSYTTPSPYEITSSGDYNTGYACWRAFNGTNSGSGDSWLTTNGNPLGWIQVNFGSSKVYNKISFTTRDYSDSNLTAPKDFKILGSSDGVNWNELAYIQNQTGWKQNETRVFEFSNLRAYQYYRLQITVANYTAYSAIGMLVFGFNGLSLLNLNNKSARSFIDYGELKKLEGLNYPIGTVKYVVQGITQNDTTTKQIDKKPLSISFN